MSKLKIVIGSTRPTRAADRVAPWVIGHAERHAGFEVEVLDLRAWELPVFQEHFGTIGDFSDPTYSDPVVRRWNQTMSSADALLVVTPEYLHSVPGVLKNALDSVYMSFALRNKPMAAVGYSAGQGGGVRALEHLAHIVIESEMVPLRNTVIIPNVEQAFGEDGSPVDGMTDTALQVLLDDLAWWSDLLARGRAAGELPPGVVRLYA